MASAPQDADIFNDPIDYIDHVNAATGEMLFNSRRWKDRRWSVSDHMVQRALPRIKDDL